MLNLLFGIHFCVISTAIRSPVLSSPIHARNVHCYFCGRWQHRKPWNASTASGEGRSALTGMAGCSRVDPKGTRKYDCTYTRTGRGNVISDSRRRGVPRRLHPTVFAYTFIRFAFRPRPPGFPPLTTHRICCSDESHGVFNVSPVPSTNTFRRYPNNTLAATSCQEPGITTLLQPQYFSRYFRCARPKNGTGWPRKSFSNNCFQSVIARCVPTFVSYRISLEKIKK